MTRSDWLSFSRSVTVQLRSTSVKVCTLFKERISAKSHKFTCVVRAKCSSRLIALKTDLLQLRPSHQDGQNTRHPQVIRIITTHRLSNLHILGPLHHLQKKICRSTMARPKATEKFKPQSMSCKNFISIMIRRNEHQATSLVAEVTRIDRDRIDKGTDQSRRQQYRIVSHGF